jgi:murein DD-endopeptidase MepM/ murein hydrolase activator NlpD
MKKGSNHYTLMFIPEDNGKTFTLKIHKNVLRSLVIFFFIFIFCLIVLLYKSGEIAARLQLYSSVKNENENLLIENEQLKQITTKIDKIDKIAEYFYTLGYPKSLNDKMAEHNKLKNNEIRENQLTEEIKSKKVNLENVLINENINSIPNIQPVEGLITRSYNKDTGSVNSEYHEGIDYAASLGTPIKATAPGIVEKVYEDKYLGKLVIINHENGFVTKYGHCSQILVSQNERVRRGQTIALVGNTGRSTAPHLHYELLKNGSFTDPSQYLLINK